MNCSLERVLVKKNTILTRNISLLSPFSNRNLCSTTLLGTECVNSLSGLTSLRRCLLQPLCRNLFRRVRSRRHPPLSHDAISHTISINCKREISLSTQLSIQRQEGCCGPNINIVHVMCRNTAKYPQQETTRSSQKVTVSTNFIGLFISKRNEISCSRLDTNEAIKKCTAVYLGKKPEIMILMTQGESLLKEFLTLKDYEIHDGSSLES